MNTPPLAGNFLSGPDSYSAQPITDLAARAAQMYQSQVDTTPSDNTAVEEPPAIEDKLIRPSRPPHGNEIYSELQKIKPERVEVVQEDGSIKVRYNYHKPFFAYLSKFSGARDGKPTYPLISDLVYVLRWCRDRSLRPPDPGTPEPVAPPPVEDAPLSEYGFKFGVTQTLMCMMAMESSIREWMYELLTTGDGPEDERAFQL